MVAIGSPSFDSSGLTNNGRLYLYDSQPGGFPTNNASPATTFVGVFTGDLYGTAAVNAGTLISDAGDTLVAAAPQSTKTPPSINGGYVVIYRGAGANPPLPVGFEVRKGSDVGCDSSFGVFLANAGNVDNLHRDDLLVGAPECDNPQTNEGKAFLLTSNATLTSAVSAWSFEVNQAETALGPVAGLGDINGDGVDDFAVGAPKMDTNSVDNGRVYVFHGRDGQLPLTTQAVSMSTTFSGQCGSAIAGGFDFNNDGYMDMIEGEPSYDEAGQANEGRVRMFFGGPDGMDFTADRTYEGNCANCRLGAALATGDVDGDGYGDVVIGRPGRTNGQTSEGDALLFKGEW